MSEYLIGYTAVGSLVGLAVMCLCYMLGGRSNKWIRRYVGSAIQGINSNVCSAIMGIWNPFLLAIFPLVAIGLSFGYGGDTTTTKIIRRSIFCIANLLSGVLFCLLFPQAWILFVVHFGVAIWTIYLGVKNPLYASAEEVFVCALLYLILCSYPFLMLAV